MLCAFVLLLSSIVYIGGAIVVQCSHTTDNNLNFRNDPRLTSVYDAMKSNFRQIFPSRNVISDGYRNKRAIIPNITPSDTYRTIDEWTPAAAEIPYSTVHNGDMVCTTTHQQKQGSTYLSNIDDDDGYHSRINLKDKFFFKVLSILKVVLISVGLLSVPFILFKLLILPMKILLGLKALSMANSILLVTLLYKYVNHEKEVQTVITNSDNNLEMMPIVDENDNIMNVIANNDNMLDNSAIEENAKRILKMIKRKHHKW